MLAVITFSKLEILKGRNTKGMVWYCTYQSGHRISFQNPDLRKSLNICACFYPEKSWIINVTY